MHIVIQESNRGNENAEQVHVANVTEFHNGRNDADPTGEMSKRDTYNARLGLMTVSASNSSKLLATTSFKENVFAAHRASAEQHGAKLGNKLLYDGDQDQQ